jgi:hypothetical protein
MPAEPSVLLADDRLQLAAVLATRVPVRAIDPPSVPGQPASRIGVDVLAVARVEQLVLERDLRLRVWPSPADLAPEHDRHPHIPRFGAAPDRGKPASPNLSA